MKIDQNVLKKIILEELQQELEGIEEQEVDLSSEMGEDEKVIDSLLSSVSSLRAELEKINTLMARAKMIPDEAKRRQTLDALKTKASDTLSMMDSVRNTIEGGGTMEEQELSSLMQENLEEALADYDPQQRNKIRDLALELVKKVTADPRWKEKADDRPSNSVEILWDMATSIFKQKEQMVSKQASEFLDSIGSDTPEEMASDISRNLMQESFQIKKSRLLEILKEEVALAKKQGLL
jgi:DNA mismatch repair ATPase MutS